MFEKLTLIAVFAFAICSMASIMDTNESTKKGIVDVVGHNYLQDLTEAKLQRVLKYRGSK